jgi:glycosyltransferase involved in cell wall biosynthesis
VSGHDAPHHGRRTAARIPTILVLTGYYLPGSNAGGPIRSIANMVERLSDEFSFRIVAPDHDVGDRSAYEAIRRDVWQTVGKAEVLYMSPARLRRGGLLDLVRSTPHDLLYLNSFFHPAFTLAPLGARRVGAIACMPTLIAPRGELSPGALSLKAYKKRPFIGISRLAGLYRGVHWHATSPDEIGDIGRTVGEGRAIVHLAPNLTAAPREPAPAPAHKRPGELRLVFMSRINAKKNLLFALQTLSRVTGEVRFDVIGPIEDAAYWQRCRAAIAQLPSNVRVNHLGALDHDHVHDALATYHAFYLPTLGENHGHAIVEAMASGLPVLISDRTPWRGLRDQQVGVDLDLAQVHAFVAALDAFAAMDEATMAAWSAAARSYASALMADPSAETQTRRMLLEAIAGPAVGAPPA